MKRLTHPRLLGGLTAALLLAQGATASAAPRLQTTFRQAADELHVPVELLVSVSYVTSSWHEARGIDPHTSQEFGVMGLRNQEEGPSLSEAAALLGERSSDLRDDPVENIRGGAALLAQYALEANHGQPVAQELSLDTAGAWWAAAARYAGVADARYQDMFAAHVFEAMDQGLEGRADSGELIRMAPIPLPSIIGEWVADARATSARAQSITPAATDYPNAAWVPACTSNYSNYSRTAADISYVVIHKIEGSYSGCISWFQNCSAQVSAHYVVSKYGEVTQMVREEDVAWHAGNWDYNLMSVGIEHEGYTNSDDVTDAEYQGSAALTRDVCDRNGIAKNRTYIIGHNEVPGATHTDPGPYWDWDYYMSLVGCSGGNCGGGGGGGGGGGTGNLVGVVKANDIYSGTPIVGATVTLSTGATTKTDSSGYYAFNALPAGDYKVTATATCYNTATNSKTVQAGVDNWASMAMTNNPDDPDPTCGDSGGDSGCTLGYLVPQTRNHTASTSPLDRLPWSSAGFCFGMGGALLLWKRRRH